jgi:chromosome segregation ATPase
VPGPGRTIRKFHQLHAEDFMRILTLPLLALVLIPSPAHGQFQPNDSQTLRDLLAEVRQLRHDLQTTSVAVQRAEILLYRVRAQQEVVAQATQRLDRVRSELDSIRMQQKNLAANIKRVEDSSQDGAASPSERKDAQEQVLVIKARLEVLNAEEQVKQATESEADQHLRDGQAKLTALESQLDRLDSELQNSGRRANAPQ